ncbi:cytosine permease [Leifsonia sp. fls2-241-R2A-40a]|uniref:cytosine permease n=1 Tax=Leifsonia sp. fls2-241-R2A-40a TaxID=3040290 RepID=UPI00254F4E04|nr:cytosine permease [Leifsonia sp. fls2-241-R2A-40a]
MERRASGDRHSDDELASALEEEVARITSAIPIIVPRASPEPSQDDDGGGDDEVGPPTELISFDDLPERREPTGPEPTFSPWVATAAVPIQRARPASEPEPRADGTGRSDASERAEEPPLSPPTFLPVARAEPLGLVPPELAPRDSEPVPVLSDAIVAGAVVAGPETGEVPVPADSDNDVLDDAEADVAAEPQASAETTGEFRPRDKKAGRAALFVPETTDLEPTPVEQRLGHASRMFWLWFAGTSSLISVGVGATLFVLGLSLRQLLVATLVGVALSFLPLGLGTLAGKWSGQPTLVVSRASFGLRGNLVPTVLALMVKLFWGAVLLWLAGSAAGSLTTAEHWPGSALAATAVALAVTAFVAVAVAYFGYALVARIQLVLTIASAALIALMVAATWNHVDVTRALAVPDALWTHVLTGAVIVFSYVGLAWAMSSAEVARYQRPLSSGGAAMLWATFGAGVPPFVLVSYGGLLAASDPTAAAELARDPVAGLVRLGLPGWYPVPLLLAVGLSLISALVLTVYSAGFTLDALGVRLGRRWSTLAAGVGITVVGVLLAATVTDLSAVIRGVPTALSVPVAAWVGVFSGEMMLRTRRFHQASLLARGGEYPDWRWTNLGLLIGGTVVGLGLISSPLPWLAWEGYLFRLVGIDPHAGIGASNIGVLVALGVGLIGALVSGAPAVRRQELAAG